MAIQEPKKEPKYLSLREAAQIYGYTRDHLGLMIRKGRLEGARLGNYYVTTGEWMDYYVKNYADAHHPLLKNKFSNKRISSIKKSVQSLRSIKPVLKAKPQPKVFETEAPEIKKENLNLENLGLAHELREDIQQIITAASLKPLPTEFPALTSLESYKDHDFLIIPIRKMEDFERQMIISKASRQEK